MADGGGGFDDRVADDARDRAAGCGAFVILGARADDVALAGEVAGEDDRAVAVDADRAEGRSRVVPEGSGAAAGDIVPPKLVTGP